MTTDNNIPQYTHDCDSCIFLGRCESIDVHWCDNTREPNLSSIIGRYGNDGPEYASSHPPSCFAGSGQHLYFSQGWYHFALREGKKRFESGVKIYNKTGWEAIDKLYKIVEEIANIHHSTFENLRSNDCFVMSVPGTWAMKLEQIQLKLLCEKES